MWDYELNAPHTAHTTNLVPVDPGGRPGQTNPPTLRDGALCDVAPTMLALLGIEPSKEMTGKDLRARLTGEVQWQAPYGERRTLPV